MATTTTRRKMTPKQDDSLQRARRDFLEALDQIHALAMVQLETASIELKATDGHPDAHAHLRLAARLVADVNDVMFAADC